MTTIKVGNIPEEGQKLHFVIDGDQLQEFVDADRGMAFRPRDIDVSCEAIKVRETVNLDLHVRTEVDFDCGRCLEPFTLPVTSDFKYTLVPFREETRSDGEISSDDDAFGYYREDLIDVELIVFEQILLQIPVKPLCREACRGLCHRCGKNLNVEPCSCQDEPPDGRFSALKNFNAKK